MDKYLGSSGLTYEEWSRDVDALWDKHLNLIWAVNLMLFLIFIGLIACVAVMGSC